MWNTKDALSTIPNISKHFTHIYLTGGEPLLFEDIALIIKELKQAGLNITLLTNGVLLDKQITQKMIKNGLDKIIISLDSLNKTTNDCQRGLSEIIMTNLEDILSYSQKISIQISVTITKKNLDDIEDLITYAKKYNIELWLNTVDTNNNELGLKSLDESQRKKLDFLLKKWNKVFCNNELTGYCNFINELIDDKIISTYCPMGRKHFVLDVNGEIYPCFLQKKKITNIMNDKDWEEKIKITDHRSQIKCAKLGCLCLTCL